MNYLAHSYAAPLDTQHRLTSLNLVDLNVIHKTYRPSRRQQTLFRLVVYKRKIFCFAKYLKKHLDLL